MIDAHPSPSGIRSAFAISVDHYPWRLSNRDYRLQHNCLLFQLKLHRESSILDLHDIIRKTRKVARNEESRFDIERLWESRHVEQFCANMAWFDAEIIAYVLRAFLLRPVEDLAPAYIHGKTSYFYITDGKVIERTLGDEAAFRERLGKLKEGWEVLSGRGLNHLKENEGGSVCDSPLHGLDYTIVSRFSCVIAGNRRRWDWMERQGEQIVPYGRCKRRVQSPEIEKGKGHAPEAAAYHFELISKVFLLGRHQDFCKDRSYIDFN